MDRETDEPPADSRQQADSRFAAALEATGAPDPRQRYRAWLRELRGRDEAAFRKALDYFENQLVPAVANPASDPLVEWTEYGLRLAQRLRPGSAVSIDATGRSRPYQSPAALDELVLHLPRASREPALAVRLPPHVSPAQHATLELLVRHSLA